MKDRVREKLEEIAEVLYKYIQNQKGELNEMPLGLYNGEYGILLFLFYYSKYTNNSEYYNITKNYAEQLLNKLPGTPPMYTFCSGLSGILYLFEFFRQNNFIDINIDEGKNDLENYLLNKMKQDMLVQKYDFMHGFLGGGLYFLKTGKHQNILYNLINYLYNIADKKDHVFKWKTILNEKGEQGYNVALSHGMSSILIFLAKTLENGIGNNAIAKMMDATATYILNQQIDPDIYGSYFPNYSIENCDFKLAKSRLAWCYGDLGAAVSLWYAGKILKNEGYKQDSLRILLHSTKRLSLEKNFIYDAGICHGSAGVAMIYKRMYIESGKKEFKNSFNYWVEKTLELSSFKDGLAGYKTYFIKKWEKDYSFLTGVSGIGLVFMSYLTNDNQDWDEMLLLS